MYTGLLYSELAFADKIPYFLFVFQASDWRGGGAGSLERAASHGGEEWLGGCFPASMCLEPADTAICLSGSAIEP